MQDGEKKGKKSKCVIHLEGEKALTKKEMNKRDDDDDDDFVSFILRYVMRQFIDCYYVMRYPITLIRR